MFDCSRHFRNPFLATVTACLLALGAASCGGSDDGDTTAASAEAGGDEQQVRNTVETLYGSISKGDGDTFCEQLTETGQKEFAQGVGGKGCTEGFDNLMAAANKSGGLGLKTDVKVRYVNLDGDKATVEVAFAKGGGGQVPLEKVDGVWRVKVVGGALL